MEGVLVRDLYHPAAGFVFVFNLIVGTGALTMPKAFSSAGWVLSTLVIVTLCFMSFVTVTFVIETMSIANYVLKSKHAASIRLARSGEVEEEDEEDDAEEHYIDSETSRLIIPSGSEAPEEKNPESESELYQITRRVEMGSMAKGFLPPLAVKFFYTAIAVYLYGDLVIYSAAISKSVRDISCTYQPDCNSSTSLTDQDECWLINETVIRRGDAYRIFIAAVLVLLVPFAYFDVSKTKYIQIITTLFRWGSFTTMIILASVALGQGKGKGHPEAATISGLPNLFGVCVYSFMCHHSLPTLITPISRKNHLYRLVFFIYVTIMSFYLLLSFTGAYTFRELQDIYTLNFQSQKCSSSEEQIIHPIPFLQYFLPLFPVVTLSTSFPIIAITLTYNLRSLLKPFLMSRLAESGDHSSSSSSSCKFFIDHLFFPSIAAIPPVFLSMITDDLQVLVGIVGSYAGACIQYVIPALLIYYARKHQQNLSSTSEDLSLRELQVKQSLTSPFKHNAWIAFVLIWAVVCMIFVTVNHFIPHPNIEMI